jgi:hypothetical protein
VYISEFVSVHVWIYMCVCSHVCLCVHNDFIYIHMNSKINYLRKDKQSYLLYIKNELVNCKARARIVFEINLSKLSLNKITSSVINSSSTHV